MKNIAATFSIVGLLVTWFVVPVQGVDPATLDLEILRQGHIVVRGSVGPVAKLTFMIDTGASVTAIDQGLVDKLGLEKGTVQAASLFDSGGQFPEVVLEDLAMGPARIESVEAVVMDFSMMNLGKRVDVIVGLDVLRQLEFTIDYRSRKLQFGALPALEHQAAIVGMAPLLLVEVSKEGRSLRMMLDSGAGESVLCESRVKDMEKHLGMRSVERLNHLQGGTYVRRVELRGAVMGTEALEPIPAVLAVLPGLEALELDGILALRSLGQNRVHFDFDQGLLSWGN